ncbi:MAG: sulfurtransferase FdhD, partial [Methanosarcinales archaeon]|nr:sulfurtransferase FdhD [Methanosarcinales archaeon]
MVEEVPLSIFINGRHYSTAMMSPGMEREFIMGHLFSEGMVRNLDELISLDLEGQIARAMVHSPVRAMAPRKAIVSGCGGGSSFLDPAGLPRIESHLAVDPDDILAAVAAISSSDLHRAAGGTHSVGLFSQGGQAAIIAEDIGRHNALDKAIGHCLSHDQPLE